MRLLGIGDNVLDHYVDTGVMYPGGNAVNVAVYAAHLGAKDNAYIGIVGNDVQGDHLMSVLAGEGLDISQVRRAVGPTGSPRVSIDESGDRIFVGSNKGGVQHGLRLRLTPEDLALARAADVVHTSVYSSLEDVLGELAAAAPVSFDFSDRRAPEYLASVCPHITHAFFSGSGLPPGEARALAGKALELGCTTAVVTLGADGALVATADRMLEQPPVKTEVIDTLGAGDGFIAGFLVSFYSGSDIPEAAAAGAESAARACGVNGAFGQGLAAPAV